MDPPLLGCCLYAAGMGEIVNLKQVKKRQARERASAEAAVNRAKHGRTAAEKANDRRAEARRQALLDGAQREAEACQEEG
ncbi:DUF4169 family protein [Belnapia arida]|nr:DUF4169 family protein [Belnapia arida]